MSRSGVARSLAALACTLLVLSACSGQWNGQVVEEEGGFLGDATVKADVAIEKARAAVPEGTILSAAIEREDGALIYTFDIKIEGKEGIEEVHIDAMTGALLSNEHESEEAEEREEAAEVGEENEQDENEEQEENEAMEAAEVGSRWDGTVKEDEAGLLAKATVSTETAIQAALAAVPGGEITAAEIENEDGKFIYSFDIRVEGKPGIDEVWVDAMTGIVISVEHEQ